MPDIDVRLTAPGFCPDCGKPATLTQTSAAIYVDPTAAPAVVLRPARWSGTCTACGPFACESGAGPRPAALTPDEARAVRRAISRGIWVEGVCTSCKRSKYLASKGDPHAEDCDVRISLAALERVAPSPPADPQGPEQERDPS